MPAAVGRGGLWAHLLSVIHVVDNSISLEGHIITYFKIRSQLREHSSLWECVQRGCQACNSRALQNRARERRIKRREAQPVLPASFPTKLFRTGGMWLFVSVRDLGSALAAVPEHHCLLAWVRVQPASDALPSVPPFLLCHPSLDRKGQHWSRSQNFCAWNGSINVASVWGKHWLWRALASWYPTLPW